MARSVDSKAAGGRVAKRMRRHTRYLSQSVVLEEIGPPGMLRTTLLLLATMVFGFFGWAAITQLTESTRAVGFVTPTGSVMAVQHLEGGIVTEILVRDGALVEPGAVLVRLDPTAAHAELEGVKARVAALTLQAERLRAFADDRDPDYSGVGVQYQALIDDQLAIYALQEKAREGQRKVIEYQIAQRQAEFKILENGQQSLAERVDIAREMLKIRETLVKKGLVSRIDYLNTRRELNTAQREYSKNEGTAVRARQAIAESRGKLVQFEAELRNEAAVQMGQVTTELAQLHQAVAKLRDRMTRIEIRSPVRGIIKGLKVNTIGGVVPAGGVITEIVPLERDLIVEARLPPTDIGHLEVGQVVAVKVQTFDFARYGSIPGELRQISATTFRDEEGNVFYKGSIKLARNYVGENPTANLILPGMVVDVDINTGQRTLLRYLLRPVYESLDRAFGER